MIPALHQVDLVSPIWWGRALIRPKVDGFVLHTQDVDLPPASQWGQILCFEPPDLYRSSPESGDLQCEPGVSKTTIWFHSEDWWYACSAKINPREAQLGLVSGTGVPRS